MNFNTKASSLKASIFKIYARAVITNDDGQVLIVKKRKDQDIAPDQWLLPGGTIELGETPEQALTRELLEEVQFTTHEFCLFASETRIIKGVHWLGLLFMAKGDPSQVYNAEPDKHEKIEWSQPDLVISRLHLSPTDPTTMILQTMMSSK